MEKYYEKLGFIQDPYERLNPYLIDEKFLEWDRPDLQFAKKEFDHFISDVIDGRRVGLRIFGQTGSGKTWLTKIIDKELSKKSKEANKHLTFIYTLIPVVEPSFSVMYEIAIDHFLVHDFKFIADYVEREFKYMTKDSWLKIVNHNEIADVLARIQSGNEKELAIKWLKGERLSTTELGRLRYTYQIDGDYKRLTILKELMYQLSKNFGPVVFVVDELENVLPKLAAAIGDSLRSLLDDFSNNFSLIATFTAEKEDEWYEIGYSEQLSRRFDYLIRLDSLESEKISDFLSAHHKLYMSNSSQDRDPLYPFSGESLSEILKIARPEYHYPGFVLPNCGRLAREFVDQGLTGIIDLEFTTKHKTMLKDV